MKKTSFSGFDISCGMIFDYTDNQHPTRLWGFDNAVLHMDQKKSTYYGYVYKGTGVLTLVDSGRTWAVTEGMYFCLNEPGYIQGAKGIVVERVEFNGMFMIGGPVETWGRLKYIDGCTDSLLVPPVMLGDPCLNALFFPPGIDQTMHTHPSMRVGMVIRGNGKCRVPGTDPIPLHPGKVFIIHQNGDHKFSTLEKNETMTVIAYHPDSDHGPEDEKHPMINRTIVDGRSASEIEGIRTGDTEHIVR